MMNYSVHRLYQKMLMMNGEEEMMERENANQNNR